MFSLLMQKLRTCVFHSLLIWWKIIDNYSERDFAVARYMGISYGPSFPCEALETLEVGYITSTAALAVTPLTPSPKNKTVWLESISSNPKWLFVILILLLVFRRDYLRKYLSGYGGTSLGCPNLPFWRLVLLLPFTREVVQYYIQHLKVNFIRL